MRLAVVTFIAATLSLQAWAQDAVFADGFELAHPCRWSAQLPPADCSAAEIIVNLPGNVPLVLVRIPPGVFQMGSPVSERGRADREDLHQVTLTQAYYIGKYEVTQAQWEAVMGTTPWWDCGNYGVGGGYPAYCVSWYDAVGFADGLNTYLGTTLFRLPTDAEWERAARAGNQLRFSHGDVLECGDFCEACALNAQYIWWCGNLNQSSQPVGALLPSAFELDDMHGNVWEWVQDWYTDHLGTDAVTDPTGPGGGMDRVHRGGSWGEYAQACRAASRGASIPSWRYMGNGFRIARSVE